MPPRDEDPSAVFTAFDRGMMAYRRKDFDAAREVLLQAGDDGRACWWLGQLASEGSGRPEDPALAATYYERAAALGEANGAYCLGALYALGRGVDLDYTAAMRWYECAGDLGMPMGWRQVGIMHAVGQGVPADLAAAEPWWLRAAAAGNAEAMGDLGQLHAYHREDVVTAVEWYRKAGDAGLAGVSEHLNRLAPRLAPLAKAGDLRAATLLAGLLSSNTEAREHCLQLLEPPAAAGDPEAQRLLGFLLAQDEDDRDGQARAVELFRAAAEAGDAYGAMNLSSAYAHGHSVPADAVEAVRWARVAAEAGQVDSYGVLGERLSVLDQDEEALSWFVKGAQAGDRNCALTAAAWYRDGYGTAVDHVQSLRWLLSLFWTDRMGDGLHEAHNVVDLMNEADVYRAGSQAGQPDLAVSLWNARQARQARRSENDLAGEDGGAGRGER